MASVKPYSGIVLPSTFHGTVFHGTVQGPVLRARPVPLASGANPVAISQATFSSAASAWQSLTSYEQGLWSAGAVPPATGYSQFSIPGQLALTWGVQVPYEPNPGQGIYFSDVDLGITDNGYGRSVVRIFVLTSDPLYTPAWFAVYWCPNQWRTTFALAMSGCGYHPAVPTAAYEFLGFFGPCPAGGSTDFDVTDAIVARLGFRWPAFPTPVAPDVITFVPIQLRYYINKLVTNYDPFYDRFAPSPPPYVQGKLPTPSECGLGSAADRHRWALRLRKAAAYPTRPFPATPPGAS